MTKKGQIAIFILLGIIIVIATVIFIQFQQQKTITAETTETSPVNTFVAECLANTASHGLNFVSERGGYYNLPERNASADFLETAYWKFLSDNLTPNREQIGNSIAMYINDNLEDCLENFSVLNSSGYNIEKEPSLKPKSNVTITNEKIFVKTTYPLSVKKGNSQTELADFSSSISSNELNRLLDISQRVLESQETYGICVSCLEDIENQTNTIIKYVIPENETAIFLIYPAGKETPDALAFAVKFYNATEALK